MKNWDCKLICNGYRALLTAFGIALGMTTVAAVCAYIMPFLANKQAFLINLVRYVGAAYLIWLSFQAFRHWHTISQTSETTQPIIAEPSDWGAFLQGYLCNVTNPKCLLFYISLFAIILTHQLSIGWRSLYLTTIFIEGLAWFTFVVCLLNGKYIKQRLAHIRQLQLWVSRLSAIIFLLFALLLLLMKV
ncbi:MAG: LysE family translocator [Gammaproteobacteria bacterium]|nr:LysE family translocator [Gammaproteobacteria bacterium]